MTQETECREDVSCALCRPPVISLTGIRHAKDGAHMTILVGRGTYMGNSVVQDLEEEKTTAQLRSDWASKD